MYNKNNSNLNNETNTIVSYEKIGQRITELRKLANKSQIEVITALQLEGIYITNKSLSKYEKGQVALPLDVLVGLSNLYHKDTDYILKGTVSTSSYSEQELEELAMYSKTLSSYFVTLLSPDI